MTDEPVIRHWLVSGQVQGVGFRAFVWREASRRELAGWVCNRFDGSVEILVTGPEAALADLHQAVHEGPRFARVDRVEELPVPDLEPMVVQFEVRRDR